MFRPKMLALMLSLSFGLITPTFGAPAKHVAAPQSADTLYEAGKFEQAENAYKQTLAGHDAIARPAAQKLAHDLLGLARSQAARADWAHAAENYQRALQIAEAFSMPRSFIDQLRSGLTEAQAKAGHPIANSTTHSPGQVEPLPIPTRRATTPRTVRTTPLLPSLVSGSPARDAAEEQYLRQCAVHYVESVYGANSPRALLSNLDLATYLANQSNYEAASPFVQKSTTILSSLKPEEQATLSPLILDFATRLADSDQQLLASMVAQPVMKLGMDQAPNAPDLSAKFSKLSESFQRRQNYSQAETFAKHAIAMLEKSTGVKDSRLAAERLKLASLLEAENKTGAAIELYEIALPNIDSTAAGSQGLRAYISLAQLYLRNGSTDKAKTATDKLISLGLAAQTGRDYSWMKPASDLSLAFARAGAMDDARRIYKLIAARASGMDPNSGSDYQLDEAIRNLVAQFEQFGQPAEAEQIYLAVLQNRKTAIGEPEASIGTYADLTSLYLKQGAYDKAKQTADSAVALGKRFGRSTRQYHRLVQMARDFQQRERFPEALAITEALADMPGATVDIRDYVDNCSRAAVLYDKTGNPEKAKLYIQKCIDLVNKETPQEATAMLPALKQIVDQQQKSGHLANAATLLVDITQNLQWLSNTHQNRSYVPQILSRLATASEQENMPNVAVTLYKQAIDQQNKIAGPSSVQVAGVLQQYANALRNAGNTQEAQEIQNASRAIYDFYSREQRGEFGVYRPFSPLSETMRRWRMHGLPPDSST